MLSNFKHKIYIPLIQSSFHTLCVDRLSGSYGALIGGRTGDALVSFTSGVSQMIAVELLDCHDKEGMEGVFRVRGGGRGKRMGWSGEGGCELEKGRGSLMKRKIRDGTGH